MDNNRCDKAGGSDGHRNEIVPSPMTLVNAERICCVSYRVHSGRSGHYWLGTALGLALFPNADSHTFSV